MTKLENLRSRLAAREAALEVWGKGVALEERRTQEQEAAVEAAGDAPRRDFDGEERWQYRGPWGVSAAPTVADPGRMRIEPGVVFVAEDYWQWPAMNVGDASQVSPFAGPGVGVNGEVDLLLYVRIDNDPEDGAFDALEEHPLVRWSTSAPPDLGAALSEVVVKLARVTFVAGVVTRIDQFQYGQIYLFAHVYCYTTNITHGAECLRGVALMAPVCCPGEHDHLYSSNYWDDYPYYPPDHPDHPCELMPTAVFRELCMLSATNMNGPAIRSSSAETNSDVCI